MNRKSKVIDWGTMETLRHPDKYQSWSDFSKPLEECSIKTLIDFFKNNPDKLNNINISLRKDKIEKILNK